MEKFYFDKLNGDDLAICPRRFDNDEDGHPVKHVVGCIGLWFPDGTDQAPISYFRLMNIDSGRWGGMVKCGEGPLSIQSEAHVRDLAQRGCIMDPPYSKLSEDPVVWGFDVKDPFVEYRYYEDGRVSWKEGKEGSILDVMCEPFPYTLFIHRCEQLPTSTWYTNPCIIRGTYEGKPIIGMACHTDQHVPQDNEDLEAAWQNTTDYVVANLAGVREDGRREFACVKGFADHMVGGYWLEGEEPIVDGDAKLIGEWIRLPYVEDGTCVMPDFDIKIGPKTIHFHGKWGLKGWTEKPNLEKHGQSQVIGTFYEGDIPYKHSIMVTHVENMSAYDYKLKEKGFIVKDVRAL